MCRMCGDPLDQTVAATTTAKCIAQFLAALGLPEPSLVHANDGGYQVEWHRDGIDVELYVGPDGSVTGWFRDRDGAEIEIPAD